MAESDAAVESDEQVDPEGPEVQATSELVRQSTRRVSCPVCGRSMPLTRAG